MSMDKVLLCCVRRQNVFKVLVFILVASAIVAYQPPRKSVLEHIYYWNRLRKVTYDILYVVVIPFILFVVVF